MYNPPHNAPVKVTFQPKVYSPENEHDIGKSPCLIGGTSSNDCFSIVMLVFGGTGGGGGGGKTT